MDSLAGFALRLAPISLINKVAHARRPRSHRAMTRRAAFLDDRGVVRVSGEDAAGFLQNLLTNDVERLGPHEARYAALLTPQGKILFDFLVVHAPADAGASYLLDCDGAQAAALAKRLSLYK